jgi:hypothetical protein
MPPVAPYSITVPRIDVPVEAGVGTAQFTVDVKNEQAVLDRVVVGLESDGTGSGAADPAWFSVDRHLRPIPPLGSEQFLVTVTVPTTVTPGSYRMTPVAYSADHPPDDTKVTGPLMTVVVPSPRQPPPSWWRRWWPWWLVGLVAAALVVIAVVVVVLVLSGGSGDEALNFDGGTQVVTIPSSLPISSAFSVQATITPAAPASPTVYGGIVRAAQGGGGAWVLFTRGSQWGLSVCTPGCNAATAVMSVGQKHVVTGTYDGHSITIYQDGVQVGSAPLGGTVTSFSTVQIGRWSASFNGSIDDVAVWDTALSPSDVGSTAAHPPTGPQSGLVGLWLFDEASGQQVHDSSGSGHDGFLGDSAAPDADDPTRVPAG